MNRLDGDRNLAVAACSCPRAEDETLDSPKCAPVCLQGTGASILFVKPKQAVVWCKQLVSFGYSQFCTCPQRIRLFKTYGV